MKPYRTHLRTPTPKLTCGWGLKGSGLVGDEARYYLGFRVVSKVQGN